MVYRVVARVHLLVLVIVFAIALSGCGVPETLSPTGTPTVQSSKTPTHTFTLPPSQTLSPSPSSTSTVTFTPSPSFTATITDTPTITPTPTFDFPDVTVKMQAHCRYGPAKAFLHAADLYPGDHGTVRGRYAYSAWLYVKFDKLKYFCWVAPSVVDVEGDINKVYLTEPKLPGPSVLYGAPENVRVQREGDRVVVTWDRVSMTEDDDRGYMLDVFVCQNQRLIWYPVSLPNQYETRATFIDEPGCSTPSGGVLYTVEKHGYSVPTKIPWIPAP
jgi:hypothetical protein